MKPQHQPPAIQGVSNRSPSPPTDRTNSSVQAVQPRLAMLVPVPTDGGPVQSSAHDAVQQPSPENESPLERLERMVDTMDPALLQAAVSDLVGMITCRTNLAASSTPELVGRTGCVARAAVGEDLSATTTARAAVIQALAPSPDRNAAPSKRLRRAVDSVATSMISADGTIFNILSRPSNSAVSHLNTAHSIEIPRKLQEEMNVINNRLFDTVVKINTVGAEVAPASSQYSIMLSCSYKANGIRADWSYMTPQPYTVFLTVPPTYPESSPDIWFNGSTREAEVPYYTGAREEFLLSIRCAPAPVSLTRIATMWDDCARKALDEYALQQGGGDFTTAIGSWEPVD